jgi:hypothetical protein
MRIRRLVVAALVLGSALFAATAPPAGATVLSAHGFEAVFEGPGHSTCSVNSCTLTGTSTNCTGIWWNVTQNGVTWGLLIDCQASITGTVGPACAAGGSGTLTFVPRIGPPFPATVTVPVIFAPGGAFTTGPTAVPPVVNTEGAVAPACANPTVFAGQLSYESA